jgi:predicted O-methyltransferase YrrM
MTNRTNDTLTTPRVAALVTRLFQDAEASQSKIVELIGGIPPEERARFMSDPNADYRGFYGRAKDVFLAVSAETARLLYMLARNCRAKAIVEFGTSFGISTIHLAAALRDNGGGRVIGSEFEPSKVKQARANLDAAGLADLVDIREGDALETLASGLPDAIDLVLLDGHKGLYSRVLDLLRPALRPGALLVADNAEMCPDYIARVRRAGEGFLSVPFGDDVELTLVL